MKIKTLLIVFLTITSISLFNCKKEKSINATVNEAIEGVWYAYSVTVDGSVLTGPSYNYDITFQANKDEDERGRTNLLNFHLSNNPERTYRVINDGTEIEINGLIYQLKKLTSDELILYSVPVQNSFFWKIKADKTP